MRSCSFSSRATGLELIDGPVESAQELAESFRDISLVNRAFGGIAVARHALAAVRPATVLDVGCGIADIPLALRREWLREGNDVRMTCLDTNAELLAIARERAAGDPGMSFVHGDATVLPFADGAFDVAMCNLALHHFDPGKAVRLLRELRRVSRVSPIVTDLRRGALTWIASFAFSRLFTRNRLTRHDAPLSARRAYTPGEARALASEAGWRAPRVESYRFIRMVMLDAATL